MGTYSWMPAGIQYENKCGLAAYIRYRKNPDRIKLNWQDSNHISISCPDRDLILARGTHHATGFFPGEGWDEVIILDLAHHTAIADYNLPFYMVNYTDYFNTNGGSEIRKHKDRVDGPYVVSDSGGHQIKVGVCDYVDPRALINWYNDNVDIGLVLDIPCSPEEVGKDLFIEVAKLQKRNTDILLKGKKNSLELMNIFHGSSEDDVKRFRDICEDDKIDRLAVGGLLNGAFLPSVNKILASLIHGRKYKHYHALGILNPALALMLAKMATHDRIDVLTSDSSSSLQVALTGGFYQFNAMDKPFDILPIGYMGNFNYPSTQNVLPCGCPICSAIKYTDIFGILGRSLLYMVLMYHNIHSANTYINTLNNLVRTTSHKQLRDFANYHFRGRRSVKEVQIGLDFIEEVFQTSYEKARKKYAFYLKSQQTLMSGKGSSIFDSPGDRVAEPPIKRERIQKILQIFDEKEKAYKGSNKKKAG